MLIVVGIGFVVVLVLLWGLASRRKVQSACETAKSASGYHSVMIECGSASCKAAQAMADRVYLSSEAPLIPLPECDSERCSCRYRHRQDRRQETRREEIDAQLAVVVLDGRDNRRFRRDRRQR